MLYCVVCIDNLRAGLWALTLVALFSAGGRLLGLVLDGKSESFTVTYFIVELLAGLLGLASLVLVRNQAL